MSTPGRWIHNVNQNMLEYTVYGVKCAISWNKSYVYISIHFCTPFIVICEKLQLPFSSNTVNICVECMPLKLSITFLISIILLS